MREIGQAEWIGTTVRDLLARRNFVGRVLAVVTGAVYISVIASCEAAKQSPNRKLEIASSHNPLLAKTDEEIMWLAQKHLPMHPRAMRGDFNFSALNVGMEFESEGTSLRFENQSVLHFSNAREWQPPTIDRKRIVPREDVKERTNEIVNVTGLERQGSSLRALIGLGEGLTPSGDDYIGGWLFAQWHLRKAYPGSYHWNQRAVDDLIEYARTRTNVISHTILRDHARGQSVEPMHHLIVALLRGASLDELVPHIHKLIAIGNTSGQEMLAGWLAGTRSAYLFVDHQPTEEFFL